MHKPYLEDLREFVAALDWWFSNGEAGLRRGSLIMPDGDDRTVQQMVNRLRIPTDAFVFTLMGKPIE